MMMMTTMIVKNKRLQRQIRHNKPHNKIKKKGIQIGIIMRNKMKKANKQKPKKGQNLTCA